ncbi:MAG: C10 family peptidase, partial [Paramuribaculum sp.]|nr:C10 family peptidase [Paramuribaculum sp.]
MKSQLLKHSLRVTLAAMALSVATTGFARKLTPDEAISRANEFQQATEASQLQAPNRISAHGNMTQPDKLRLAYTAEKVGEEKAPAFYVFNNTANQEGGFIIASGDDRLRPVLAIVDSGSFDPQNLPDNLRWWLSQYEEEINAYLSSTASIAAPAITATTAGYYYDNYASWSTISPLVTTTWSQDEPYNNMCPEYGGGRSMTGCVATAMAQVINYHKYVNGKGTHSYTPANWTNSTTKVSYDFGNAEFDWKNMRDSYTGNETTAQKNAVANLMFACGVAVDMQYSASASGAFSPVNGLINYLGYHEKTAEISRSLYQSTEWEAMIYKELSQNRPLIYSGSSTEGGHAFVCDGYSQNGYFHINWGWGGYYDGYFTLSALNPDGQGIGGSDGGYNGGQSFVRMLTPNDPYLDEFEEMRYAVKFNSDFSHTSSSGNNESFSNSFYLWWAPSYPTSLRYAVCIEAADGSLMYIASSSSVSLNQFNGTTARYSVNFGSADLAAGNYRVYPAFYVPSTNTFGRLFSDGGKVQFINMTVSAAGKRTFTAGDKFNLEFSDIEISTQLYQQSSTTLTYTVTNPSDYDCIDEIDYTLTGSGSSSYILGAANMIIRAGESVTIHTNVQGTTTTGSAVPAGSYKLVFKGNKSGETFSSPTINVTVSTGRDPSLPDADQIVTSANQIPKEWLNGESLIIPIEFSATTAGQIALHWSLYYRGTETMAYAWPSAYVVDVPSGKSSMGSNDFTPPADYPIPAGEYDFVFDNYYDNFRIISQRIPITVGLTQDNITYRLGVDGTLARAVRLESTTATQISIPASVSAGSKSYPVKEISAEFMANNTAVTRVNIPASVTTIGDDAFKGTSALKYVFFDGSTVPLKSGQSAFSGCDKNMEVYVPGDAWSGYNSAFSQIAKVYAKITALKVDTDIKVNKGETATLDVTITPAQNTNPNFTVTTTESAVATAKLENGQLVIEGVDNGKATITITSAQPGFKATKINVTVSDESDDVPAESITLDKETLELTVGETAALTATVLPDNATDKTVTWASNDESIATVDAEGEVTAIAIGEAVITATCGEVTAECKVTVNPVAVAAESIKLDKETLELKVGETAALTATVLPDNATDKTVTWASSNPDVATVNADGVITAVAVGEAVITATCGEATAECKVTVNPVKAESVVL